MSHIRVSHLILFIMFCFCLPSFPRRYYIETYRSFVDALTEIERLLIMRNNPPAPPTIRMIDTSTSSSSSSNDHHNHRRHYYYNEAADNYPSSSSSSQQQQYQHAAPGIGDCVLGSDDLGMLMLHIHELRTILWQERRRFSPTALRSVSEDLAELTGTLQNESSSPSYGSCFSLFVIVLFFVAFSFSHFFEFFFSRFCTITITAR